ncbi:MAG: hypothetical protein AAFV19_20480 [Pseudomonadota bacterium]
MPRDTLDTDFEEIVSLSDLDDDQLDRLTARVFCAGGPDLELSPALMRRLQAQ